MAGGTGVPGLFLCGRGDGGDEPGSEDPRPPLRGQQDSDGVDNLPALLGTSLAIDHRREFVLKSSMWMSWPCSSLLPGDGSGGLFSLFDAGESNVTCLTRGVRGAFS